MASSINKVILVGNLGKEPEVRMTTSGKKIVSFSLATSDIWKDASGQKQEKTEWHRVVIFSPVLADVAEKFLHKGSKVFIEGSLQSREWTDNAGQKRTTTEVVVSSYKGEIALLDRASSGNSGNASNNASSEWGQGSSSSPAEGWDSAPAEPVSGAEFDDEIPF